MDERLAAILNNRQNASGAAQKIFANNIGNNGQPRQQTSYTNNALLQNPLYENYMGLLSQQSYFLKCRPVSSKEEARACQIDLDGSLWVFTDINNGRIYTKQANKDGSSSFGIYVYQQENQSDQINENEFVTKNDLAKALDYIISLIPEKENASKNAAPAEQKNDKNVQLNF